MDQKSDIFIPERTKGGGGHLFLIFFRFFDGLPSNSGHIDIDRDEEKPWHKHRAQWADIKRSDFGQSFASKQL